MYFSPLGYGLSFLRGWRSWSLFVYSGRPRRRLWTVKRTLNLLSFFLSYHHHHHYWSSAVVKFLSPAFSSLSVIDVLFISTCPSLFLSLLLCISLDHFCQVPVTRFLHLSLRHSRPLHFYMPITLSLFLLLCISLDHFFRPFSD